MQSDPNTKVVTYRAYHWVAVLVFDKDILFDTFVPWWVGARMSVTYSRILMKNKEGEKIIQIQEL